VCSVVGANTKEFALQIRPDKATLTTPDGKCFAYDSVKGLTADIEIHEKGLYGSLMMKHPSSGHFSWTVLAACAGFLACWSIGPIYIKLLSRRCTGCLDAEMVRYAVACVFWLPFLVLYGRQGLIAGSC
jgi:hypothetical protein